MTAHFIEKKFFFLPGFLELGFAFWQIRWELINGEEKISFKSNINNMKHISYQYFKFNFYTCGISRNCLKFQFYGLLFCESS